MPENKRALLRDVTDPIAQVMLRDLPDVGPIHVDSALRDIVKARDQADDRGFSRTGGTDQGSGLSGLGSEADIVQNILFCTRIAE